MRTKCANWACNNNAPSPGRQCAGCAWASSYGKDPIRADGHPGSAPTLDNVRARRRERVEAFGVLPFRVRPVIEAARQGLREAADNATRDVSRAFQRNFPTVKKDVQRSVDTVLGWMKRARDKVSGREERDALQREVDRLTADLEASEGENIDLEAALESAREKLGSVMPPGKPRRHERQRR